MATTINDIPNLNKQISSKKEEEKTAWEKLKSSPTALGGVGVPTTFDVANQSSLQRIQGEIQKLKDDKINATWYGPKAPVSAQEEPATQGVFGKTLDFALRPLYGIVGAAKHVVGQGTGSLYQDIADNMVRNKNTFGDVLKNSSVPWSVAAPLGFALDIAMDPVNWATMGTSALIPRIGMGIFKGVKTGENIAKSVSIAAKFGLLEKAATASRFIPFVKKTKAFEKLGETAIKATDDWEKLSGIDAASIIRNKDKNLLGAFRVGLNTVFDKAVEATPGAKNFLQNFIYDPVDWIRQSRYKDIVTRSLAPKIENVKGAVIAYNKGESIEPFMKKVEEQAKATLAAKKVIPVRLEADVTKNLVSSEEVAKKMESLDAISMKERVMQASDDMIKGVDDAESVLKDVDGIFVSGDPIENARRLASEKVGSPISMDELEKIMTSGALDQTGVKWFDNMLKSIRDYTIRLDRNGGKAYEIGKQTMDWYERGMAIFKVAKVAASPSAWTNAIVGNILMTHMAGASIGPGFLRRLTQSWGLYRNKSGKAALFDDLFFGAGGETKGGDVVRRHMAENPTAYANLIGRHDYIGDPISGKPGLREYAATRLSMYGRDAGILGGKSLDSKEVGDVLTEVAMQRDLKKAELMNLEMKEKEATLSNKSGLAMTKAKIKESLREGGGGIESLSSSEMGGGLLGQELITSKVNAEMFANMAQRAKDNPNNLTYKVLDYIFNKMPEGYEKVDQTFKMTTFVIATRDGYTMNELRRISKLVDIDVETLSKYSNIKTDPYAKMLHAAESDHEFTSQVLYRLSPNNALELANIMYLNYAAMPAAVKVMRNFPLLRSPFISFMYGMSLKTGQTLAYNPSAFNKVTLAMNDFGGTKTALEKKAIYDNSIGPDGRPYNEFYSYLQKQGMYRIPFFDKNPNYMNLSSAIPYYSLNIFTPSQTNYGNSTREKIAQLIQSSPVLGDPIGTIISNYFIIPLILGEAIRPQGQFGQPLYPIDANILSKTGYGLRTFGEAFVPNIAAYTGVLGGAIAPGITPLIPSYRYRDLANAVRGKNQLGKSVKEDPMARTTRSLLRATGVPLQSPVNTTFVNK